MEYGKARNPKQNLEFLYLPDVRAGEFINAVLHHLSPQQRFGDGKRI